MESWNSIFGNNFLSIALDKKQGMVSKKSRKNGCRMVSDGEANEPENNELQLNEHPDINLENPEDPGGE